MAKIHICLILLLLVMSACSDDQAVQAPTETRGADSLSYTEAGNVAPDTTEAELLAAIEDLRTAQEETNRLLTEQNRLWEEVLTLDTPASVPSPSAAVATTPRPAPRGDICDRSIPMQEKLLSLYPNVNLCAMVRLGELYRIEGLSLDGDMGRLRGSDFASMPHLRRLELRHDSSDANRKTAVLADDFFKELGNLQTLEITGDFGDAMLTDIPALPGMERLSFGASIMFPGYEGGPIPERILPPVRLPDMPNLRTLELGVDRQGEGLLHLRIDRETFVRTPKLAGLEIGGDSDTCLEIAGDALEGLTQLVSLYLGFYPCGAFEVQSDGTVDRDYDYQTILVMSNRAVAQEVRQRDQCNGQCVVVARDEVS